MTRKEEAIVIWQVLNLMHDLQRLLNRHYFDDLLDLDLKEREQAYSNEWLFPDLERKGL
jgi:hypothetical protein